MLIDLLESSKAIGLCPMGKKCWICHENYFTADCVCMLIVL